LVVAEGFVPAIVSVGVEKSERAGAIQGLSSWLTGLGRLFHGEYPPCLLILLLAVFYPPYLPIPFTMADLDPAELKAYHDDDAQLAQMGHKSELKRQFSLLYV
jgi:hypothetical protein